MNQTERRSRILDILRDADISISASKLAAEFGVTRQIIVSDIAILRANGHKIIATQRGYVIEKSEDDSIVESIVCTHSAEDTLQEFYIIIDNGGCIDNVIVEHPIYGQISADLNIRSRYDADEFVRIAKATNATQLCDLTGGLHIHMIRVPDKDAYVRIIKGLEQAGILVDTK